MRAHQQRLRRGHPRTLIGAGMLGCCQRQVAGVEVRARAVRRASGFGFMAKQQSPGGRPGAPRRCVDSAEEAGHVLKRSPLGWAVTRNVFCRSWWRAHVLGADLDAVPEGQQPLGEDELSGSLAQPATAHLALGALGGLGKASRSTGSDRSLATRAHSPIGSRTSCSIAWPGWLVNAT